MRKIIFYLLIAILGYSCNNASPCKCWKYSYYSAHEKECNKAADNMGTEWDQKEEACKDFRLSEDKVNGYTKLDMVTVKGDPEKGEPFYFWREVYVKE